MEATILALVIQVFQPSWLYGEPEQYLVSVFTRLGHAWIYEGPNIQKNKFQGVHIFRLLLKN